MGYDRAWFLRPIEFTGRDTTGSGGDFVIEGAPDDVYRVGDGVYACSFVLARQIKHHATAIHVGIIADPTDHAPRIVLGADADFDITFPAGSLFGPAIGFAIATYGATLTGGTYLVTAPYPPLLGWYPPFARADQMHWELDTDSQHTGAVARTGLSSGIATASRVYHTQAVFEAVPAVQVWIAAATNVFEPYRTLEHLIEGSRSSWPVARATDPPTSGMFVIPDYQALPADATYGGTYLCPTGHSASWVVARAGIDYFAASTPDVCTFVAAEPKSAYSAKPFLPVTRDRYSCEISVHTQTAPTFNATSTDPV